MILVFQLFWLPSSVITHTPPVTVILFSRSDEFSVHSVRSVIVQILETLTSPSAILQSPVKKPSLSPPVESHLLCCRHWIKGGGGGHCPEYFVGSSSECIRGTLAYWGESKLGIRRARGAWTSSHKLSLAHCVCVCDDLCRIRMIYVSFDFYCYCFASVMIFRW